LSRRETSLALDQSIARDNFPTSILKVKTNDAQLRTFYHRNVFRCADVEVKMTLSNTRAYTEVLDPTTGRPLQVDLGPKSLIPPAGSHDARMVRARPVTIRQAPDGSIEGREPEMTNERVTKRLESPVERVQRQLDAEWIYGLAMRLAGGDQDRAFQMVDDAWNLSVKGPGSALKDGHASPKAP
jgi:hypothetical protein